MSTTASTKLSFRHPMSFFERVGNTFATYLSQWTRDYFMMYRMEDIIDFQFPEYPRETRPSLKTLEKKTALALQVKLKKKIS
jgi:hypothetical protein